MSRLVLYSEISKKNYSTPSEQHQMQFAPVSSIGLNGVSEISLVLNTQKSIWNGQNGMNYVPNHALLEMRRWVVSPHYFFFSN